MLQRVGEERERRGVGLDTQVTPYWKHSRKRESQVELGKMPEDRPGCSGHYANKETIEGFP